MKKKLSYIGYGGKGNQTRDVLHIYDLCELIFMQIKKIDSINNSLFTVGGSTKSNISLKKLTKICQEITGNKLRITKVKKTSIYDIPYYVSSNRDVKRIYNWTPKKNINQIINDIYKWQLENRKKLKKCMS